MVFFSVSYLPSLLTSTIFNFLYAGILSTHWFQFNLAHIKSCNFVAFLFSTTKLQGIPKGTMLFIQYFLLCRFPICVVIAFGRQGAVLLSSKILKRCRLQNWNVREEILIYKNINFIFSDWKPADKKKESEIANLDERLDWNTCLTLKLIKWHEIWYSTKNAVSWWIRMMTKCSNKQQQP